MSGRGEVLTQVHLAGVAAEHLVGERRSRDFDVRIGLAILAAIEPEGAEIAIGLEGTDEHKAIQGILAMGCPLNEHAIREEVERFYEISRASLNAVWTSVEAVARALLKHRELDRDGLFKAISVRDIYAPVFAVQRAHGVARTPEQVKAEAIARRAR
jgi:hypothetical protein